MYCIILITILGYRYYNYYDKEPKSDVILPRVTWLANERAKIQFLAA
jgi:hypothetical protein